MCCVVNCHNRHSKGSGIRFYRFPTDPDCRREWLAFVSHKNPNGSPWEPGDGDRVCSCHFTSGEKSNVPTHPDYVPLMLRGSDDMKGSTGTSLFRFERAQRRSSLRAHIEEQLVVQHTKAYDDLQQHLRAFHHDHGLLYRTGSSVDLCVRIPEATAELRQDSCMLTVVDPSECISAEVGRCFIVIVIDI